MVGLVGGVASGPMVGRDRELARVTLLLDDALAGGGRLVLCTGEAGIGKTRLAEEAAAKGVPVAWARAADRDSLPPYGLWQLALAEPAVRAADDDPSRADLWSRVFGDAERPTLADGADSGRAQRFALFAEVRRRLALAASRGGLLLVLDDLQWADEASAVLLADVVRQLRGTPILVLATYRESAASGEVSAGLLSRLSADANTERVNLHGLPAGAVGEMLHAAGLPTSRWPATVSRPGWWPRCWMRPCSPCSVRWMSAGAPDSWWRATVPVITGSRTLWSARPWPPG